MTGKHLHISRPGNDPVLIVDMRNSYTCSFTEFFPFCSRLYYFSNFKDFGTSALA